MWHYDTLYWKLVADSLFNPIVAIAPYGENMQQNHKEMIEKIGKAVSFAKNKGYNYICCLDSSGEWINIREQINPDIVFFSCPYKITRPKYFIYNFSDKLTLYYPYGSYMVNEPETQYNTQFHNLLWRNFQETQFHLNESKIHSICKGDNSELIGLLEYEKMIDPKYTPIDVWKDQPHKKKRIIWAPHHSIKGLEFSSFLTLADIMVNIAILYKESVQFAFKPHPALKFVLDYIWGKEKTDRYYQQWQEMENTQLEEGEFQDLFLTSDAMIHDSISFQLAYLFSHNPVMYLLRNNDVLEKSNEFSRDCINLHYIGTSDSDINNFIENVVLGGDDFMRQKRESFLSQELLPKDNLLPSNKILTLLKETLGK